eukprot:gene41956-17277_t
MATTRRAGHPDEDAVKDGETLWILPPFVVRWSAARRAECAGTQHPFPPLRFGLPLIGSL